MKIKFLALLLVAAGCGQNLSDKIFVPQIDEDYYRSSIASVEEKISENPNDLRFVKLQLSYYEKLEWPITAKKSIDRATLSLRSDPTFINQRIAFYKKNSLDNELIDMLNQMGSGNSLPGDLLLEKVRLNIEGSNTTSLSADLERLAALEVGNSALTMANGYKLLGDNPKAIQHLRNVDRVPENTVHEFLPILEDSVWFTESVEILERHLMENEDSIVRVSLATQYLGANDTVSAKSTLAIGGRMERKLLSTLYQQELKWDSAQLFINQLITEDPLDMEVILQAGNLNQERGFFNTSLTYYYRLLDLDSTFAEAKEQIEVVNRKLAYLQRIRDAQKEIPVLNLNSKKN